MKWTLERQIPLAFTLALVLLLGIAIVSYRSLTGMRNTARLVAHSYEVIAKLEEVFSLFKDAESGVRGYVLTGNEEHLEPYTVAMQVIDQRLQQLRQLVADNPAQQPRIETLERLKTERLTILKDGVARRRETSLAAMLATRPSGRGKEVMDEIRRVVADMEQEENRLLLTHEQESQAATRRALWLIPFGSLLAVLVIGLANIAIHQELAKRRRAEQVMAQAKADLEKRVEERTAELNQQREFLRVTLRSIGDGVVVAHPNGKVSFLNQVAESLTGWTNEEAAGKEIEEVFKIVNEQTRRTVENPITKVIREGKIVGLANHTILISKDGTERPIDDSGAPIIDAQGKIVGAVLIFRDITERRRTEKQQALLAAIIESSDDAIVGKNLDGIITSWNEGAQRIFGYTAEEVIGQPITRLIPDDRQDEEPQIIEKLKRGERIDHFESVRIRKDGRLIDVSLTISPIKDSAGHVIGASKIARDISERKQAEAERAELLAREQAARQQAEVASRLKDEFLSTVSHELRTPLNAMLGWVNLLRAGRLDEATASRALETVERNARAQNKLIEDLLDVSRIITGKLRLDVQPVDLVAVVEAAIETVRPTAEAKGLRLQSILDPLAGPISGDPNRLQQVVWNLLSNAIKFTPRGGRIMVRLERINSHVEIIVSDTGQGISPEFLPYVFERFRQADSSSTRVHGGLGLGLAIVRHLVELHAGTVQAYSLGEGQGTTVKVLLPLTVTAYTIPALGDRHPAVGDSLPDTIYPSLSGVRVLVVDDEADARELIGVLLKQCGASVTTAASASEALERLEQESFDCLVSDIEMSEMDGYVFIRQVRKQERERGATRKIPAATLTAYAGAEDRTRALLEGYQIHLAKPVEPRELVATVAALISHPSYGTNT